MGKAHATLSKVRAWADQVQADLPVSLDVVAIGVKSKAPFQLLCTREALIWRTEELARTTCDALEGGNFTAAAMLARGIFENAALAWKLVTVLEDRAKYTPEKLNDLLMRMLSGSLRFEEAPKPIHVMDCVRAIDKRIPGLLDCYNGLSEIVHPNWMGVSGMYSKIDEANYIVYFGRGLRLSEGTRESISNATLGALGAFEFAYNRIADLMPAFLAELEPFGRNGDEQV